ncbi:MAG: alpha/beta fold hydrolase [Carbonactinosporaceae bacterium]
MSTPPFLELPLRTRARHLDTDRGRFAVLDAPAAPGRASRATPPSTPSTPSTVLMVPGYTGSKEDFIAVLGPLAAHDHRVVAIDQRGQYQTPGPDTPDAYTVEELARDVLAVAKALDDGPVHMLGHSFGGLVARAAALADPTMVRSLTVMDSGPAAVTGREADRLRQLLEALPVMDLPTIWRVMKAADAAAGSRPPTDPAVAAFLEQRFLANAIAGLAGMGRALLGEPDRVTDLLALGLPTLVTYGAHDYVWAPAIQADMAARLRARHAPIAAAAHSPAVERPGETAAALVEFWRSA